MSDAILMPTLSPTMEEGTLTKWLIKVGDDVRAGDVIAEIETDKATLEFESEQDGIIAELLVKAGTPNIKINTPIAKLAADGETVAPTPAPAAAPAAQTAQAPDPAPAPDWPEGTRIKQQTLREALRDALAEEMRRDSDVLIMGEEVAEYQGTYRVTQGLWDEFGSRRVRDTPITEHALAGIGVGAAFGGLRPVVEFMTFNFAMQAIDQIVNSAAKTHYMSGGTLTCPLVFRGPNGAAARVGAQHAQDFAAWYSHIPGLKVVAPFSASDAKGLLKSAIRDPNPVIFLEHERLYSQSGDVPALPDFTVPLGKARIWRSGADVTLVSFGAAMQTTLAAAEALAEQGISAEVIDLRTIRPLDSETVLASLRKTNRCVTVEEGFATGSVGAQISALAMAEAFDHLDAPVINVTGQDVPMPYAANLETMALPSVDAVIDAVRRVTYR